MYKNQWYYSSITNQGPKDLLNEDRRFKKKNNWTEKIANLKESRSLLRIMIVTHNRCHETDRTSDLPHDYPRSESDHQPRQLSKRQSRLYVYVRLSFQCVHCSRNFQGSHALSCLWPLSRLSLSSYKQRNSPAVGEERSRNGGERGRSEKTGNLGISARRIRNRKLCVDVERKKDRECNNKVNWRIDWPAV